MTMSRCFPPSLPALAALVALAGVSGCASPLVTAAVEARKDLIGLSRAELLSCAGAPDAQAEINPGEDVLSYVSRRSDTYVYGPSVDMFGYGGAWGYGVSAPILPRYESHDDACKASFTVRRGLVTRIVYGGNGPDDTARMEQCYRIVENCVAPKAPPPKP